MKTTQKAVKATAPKGKLQPFIYSVQVEFLPDDFSDLSFLDQYENSTEPDERGYYKADQERKAQYCTSWEMLGIQAKATIYIPFEVFTGNGKEINYKTETITSGGLWSLEQLNVNLAGRELHGAQIESYEIQALNAQLV